MTIRVAAIEVSHWHALNDAAYLRHLIAMPDVQLVAIQDSDAGIVARRAADVGNPETFTDHRKMLAAIRPDFVLALGRHSQMAAIAHDLIDNGFPFLMEKPMSINAGEIEAVAAKAAKRNAFVAVPLAQRYGPFATRGRRLISAGRLGPLSHIYVRINRPGPHRYLAWDCAWMLDPKEAGGGCRRNTSPPAFARGKDYCALRLPECRRMVDRRGTGHKVRCVGVVTPLGLVGNVVPTQRQKEELSPDFGRSRAAHGFHTLLGDFPILGRRGHGTGLPICASPLV